MWEHLMTGALGGVLGSAVDILGAVCCAAVRGPATTRSGGVRRSASGASGTPTAATTVFVLPGTCNPFFFSLFPFSGAL